MVQKKEIEGMVHTVKDWCHVITQFSIQIKWLLKIWGKISWGGGKGGEEGGGEEGKERIL